MKIFLAQQNYHIGNFNLNTTKILAAIKEATDNGGDLVVFSELAVCGYPPRDFLEFNDFIDQCLEAVSTIAAATQDIAVLVGAPARNPDPLGKDLYNAAYFLYGGRIQQVIHKTLLPTYDIFDEYRYFEPADAWKCVHYKGLRLAVTVCEDIWNLSENPLYRSCPMDKLIEESPHLMINLSASPFDYLHAEGRQDNVKRNVLHYGLPMVYVNTVGSQTEVVFDGGSVAMDRNGNVITALPYFAESLASVEFDESGFVGAAVMAAADVPIMPSIPATYTSSYDIDEIHDALILGIRDYFQKMGFGKAVVASSGGLDSAVVLALACEALGAQNVFSVLMPSQFSTSHSISDAEALSRNLGSAYEIIPIKDTFDQARMALSSIFKDLPFNVAEENMQARIRGMLVMAIANKFNYILLNTSNKSELAVGYGTLYGDLAGGISVLGDVYKTQVYELARYINRNAEYIPRNILTKAPSAELSPGQKDTDSLPPYDVLDPLLYQYIERRQGPKDLILQGYDEALVARILSMVNRNEYKRNQFCPIIRVSPKAFGSGRRMPIVGKYLS